MYKPSLFQSLYLKSLHWKWIPGFNPSLRKTVHLLSGAALGITDKTEAQSPAPSPHSTGTDPRMKELRFVILTCLVLSSAELTEKVY